MRLFSLISQRWDVSPDRRGSGVPRVAEETAGGAKNGRRPENDLCAGEKKKERPGQAAECDSSKDLGVRVNS